MTMSPCLIIYHEWEVWSQGKTKNGIASDTLAYGFGDEEENVVC